MAASGTAGLLARQLKQMQTDKDIPGISCGLVNNNVFEWEVMLMINDDCKFYGGELHTSDQTDPLGRQDGTRRSTPFSLTALQDSEKE